MARRSVEASDAIWKLKADLNTSERLMLLALAHFADENFECYPGVGTLADMCNVTKRQAIRLVHGLRDHGHIAFERNLGGFKKCNHYRLLIPINGDMGVTVGNPDGKTTVTSAAENGDIQGTKTATFSTETVTSRVNNGDIAMSPEGFKGLKEGEDLKGFEGARQNQNPPFSSLRSEDQSQPPEQKPKRTKSEISRELGRYREYLATWSERDWKSQANKARVIANTEASIERLQQELAALESVQ